MDANFVLLLLPGPTRERDPQLYLYWLKHRADDPRAPGCIQLWDVTGGRMTYQIAQERGEDGSLSWHCTCGDAVFVSLDRGRYCKHLAALFDFLPPEGA
jgi:hypothetical protein